MLPHSPADLLSSVQCRPVVRHPAFVPVLALWILSVACGVAEGDPRPLGGRASVGVGASDRGGLATTRGVATRDAGFARRDSTVLRCVPTAAEGTPLVLPDGRHAYVEPSALLHVDDQVVVVGSPTYTWDVGRRRARMASDGAHIAAYLGDGPPRLIDSPFEGELGFERAVGLGGGRWGVLVSLQANDERGFTRTVGIRYAEFDGRGWSDVEPLPLPDQELVAGTSSALVHHGDRILWAAVTREAGAVYLYARTDGVWSFERIQERGLEAAAIGAGPSGLWLAVKGLDPGVEGPTKSVRLYRWSGQWRLVTRDPTPEPYTEIGNPQLLVLESGVTLTWSELSDEGVLMARVGVGPATEGTLVALGEGVPLWWSLSQTAREPSWVLQRNDPDRGPELRLVRLDSAARPVVAQAIPLPYTGLFAATADGPDAVLVTGPEFDPDPARPTVRSLTLRLTSSC